MDQSRKSSEREKIALHQAHEALDLKETVVADALQATARENYMLELMTEASQDMAVCCAALLLYCSYVPFSPHCSLYHG